MNKELRIMRSWKKVIFILLFAFCFLLFAEKSAEADFSLGITPAILQIDAVAPTDIRQNITIGNGSDQTVTLGVVLKPFTQDKNLTGNVEYLLPKDVFGADPKIFDKIQILDNGNPVNEITLAPSEKKTLTLKIGLPQDEPPSDYYFSVLFVTKNNNTQQQSGSSITGGIASNVLLSVGPKGPTNGLIEQFFTPWFVETGPVPFTLLVHNLSSHFTSPYGEILIKNMYNQLVGKVDLLQVNILANTSRYIPDTSKKSIDTAYWDEKFLFGPYKATLILSLSPEGPIFRRTIYFFAMPFSYIIAATLALIIILIVIDRIRRKLSN